MVICIGKREAFMQRDVFISYAQQDKESAETACAALESQDVSCWIAPRDMEDGVGWAEAILNGLDGARVFILMFSGHANETPQMKRDIERATNRRLHVIPVGLDNTVPSNSLAFFIGHTPWVEALAPKPDFQRLLAKVRALLQ
jgi:hypothetical protein